MSPSEVVACYRLFAAYCVESAQDTLDAGRKIALLNMAQDWSRLAERVEKNGAINTIETAKQSP
jgi:hypothetical protein